VLKILEKVWARRACVGANQQELITSAQKGRQQRFEKESFLFDILNLAPTLGWVKASILH
jgi:hypothetical protein